MPAGAKGRMIFGGLDMKRISMLVGAVAALLATFSTAQAEETEYASLGRWRIIAVSDGGQFAYCAADTDNGQVQLRVATDGNQWQLGVPYYDAGPIDGQWGFDGWEDYASFRTDGDGWATMDVNAHILESLRRMDNFSIEIDRGPQHFSLRGSSAALKKAVECARNRGVARMANSGGGRGNVGGGLAWVRGNPDQPIDRRALEVGKMPDGFQVFACVASYNGGMHPGMTGMWIEGCSTGYGGREVVVRDYSVLIGRGNWVRSANGQVPGNAMPAGNEANGAPLYICRARHDGLVYSGKTRPGFNGCNVPDSGQELTIRAFDVLVQ